MRRRPSSSGGKTPPRRPKSEAERELYNFDINRIIEELSKTDFNDVDLGNGLIVQSDKFSLLRECHILAKTYGLGGCRSFTEYVDMINKEDPVLINSLMAIITDEARSSAGFEPRKKIEVDSIYKYENKQDFNYTVQQTHEGAFVNFLVGNGVDKEKIKAAQKRIKDCHVVPIHDDFLDVTSEVITSDNYDMKSLMKRFKKFRENSIGFKINPGDFNNFGNNGKK